MKLKIKITVGIILVLFSSNLISLSSNFSQSNGVDSLSEKNNEEPTILDGVVYDYYANGEVVNRGSSVNPSPRVASTSSHPLTKNESLFMKLEEIAILPNEPEEGWVFDDVGTSFSKNEDLFSEQQLYNNLWGDEISVTVLGHLLIHPRGFGGFTSDIATGDVDGDGLDEVIIATDGDSLEIYDDANHSYSKRTYQIGNFPNTALPKLKTIATGDVDGDGIDEIVYVRCFFSDSEWSIGIRMWIFDAVEWRCLHNEQGIFVYSSTFEEVSMEPEVAMGDVDGDGLDEIVVGYSFGLNNFTTADIHIFDDFDNAFSLLWRDNLFFDHLSGGNLVDIDITCGDFDGDRKDEIAYAACPYNGEQTEGALLIIDDSGFNTDIDIGYDFQEVAEFRIESPGGVWVRRMPVACGDLDGDGRDEISLIRSYKQEYPGDVFIYEWSQGDYILRNAFDWDFPDFILTMGDVDCDGLAELVFSGRYGNHVVDDANHGFTHIMNKPLSSCGLVACGDVDGDGMRLKYTGETWSNTAPPGVLVALAAPPVYAGIVQNDAWSWSAFGKATSISTAETEELGTSISSTISFEQTIDVYFFEVLSFSWSRTVGREMARTNTQIKTAVQEISYSSGCWEDSVIYHLTDYQSYKYLITHHPFDTSIIGHHITLDIPYTPSILKTTTDYFDSHYEQTLRTETFNHTIGCPWTYPARNETSDFASGSLQSGDPIAVGQGTGNNVVTIELEEIAECGIEVTEFSDYTVGGAVCGLGYEESIGTTDAKGYEISMGESCIYEGSVGDIMNEARWEQLQYSFGIFVYYVTHSNGFTYQVINYYVEGAVPYYPSSLKVFLTKNWEWLTGVGAGVIGITAITITSVALVKRRKLKPTTKKKSKAKKTTKKATKKKRK